LSSESPHSVGVIAESAADLHTLKSVVLEAGLTVGKTLEFSQWRPEQALPENIEAWLVNLDVEKLEQECPEKVDALIDNIPGLMILCEGGSPPTPAESDYIGWKRRLLGKIEDIAGTLKLEAHETGAPTQVWVLAGSIGGPQAITEFFEALPPELGVAFVYANHLQTDFENVLAQSVEKNSHYPAYVPSHGDVLSTDKVAVVSPEKTTMIKANGTIVVSKEEWQGQYQPNLDQVIASVAKTFGHTGGVIIFSGMCDDGAASCRIMKQSGGKVWAQLPESCVSSAMPDAAIETGCVEKVGTPEELAIHLTSHVNEINRRARYL